MRTIAHTENTELIKLEMIKQTKRKKNESSQRNEHTAARQDYKFVMNDFLVFSKTSFKVSIFVTQAFIYKKKKKQNIQ